MILSSSRKFVNECLRIVARNENGIICKCSAHKSMESLISAFRGKKCVNKVLPNSLFCVAIAIQLNVVQKKHLPIVCTSRSKYDKLKRTDRFWCDAIRFVRKNPKSHTFRHCATANNCRNPRLLITIHFYTSYRLMVFLGTASKLTTEIDQN